MVDENSTVSVFINMAQGPQEAKSRDFQSFFGTLGSVHEGKVLQFELRAKFSHEHAICPEAQLSLRNLLQSVKAPDLDLIE